MDHLSSFINHRLSYVTWMNPSWPTSTFSRVFLTVKIAVQGILYNYMFNEVFEGLKKTSFPHGHCRTIIFKKNIIKKQFVDWLINVKFVCASAIATFIRRKRALSLRGFTLSFLNCISSWNRRKALVPIGVSSSSRHNATSWPLDL